LIRLIAKAEGINITDEALQTLRDYARGDAGAAIMILEAAATAAAQSTPAIDKRRIDEVAQNAFFQREKAGELIDLSFNGRYKDMRARLEFLMRDERIGGRELLVEIHEALRRKMKSTMAKEDSNLFARLVVYEGETDLNLCNSLNTLIHLEEMLANFSITSGKKPKRF
jgi:DNA polymerase III delta prime subunit